MVCFIFFLTHRSSTLFFALTGDRPDLFVAFMVEEVLASTGIAAARALEDEDAESIDVSLHCHCFATALLRTCMRQL